MSINNEISINRGEYTTTIEFAQMLDTEDRVNIYIQDGDDNETEQVQFDVSLDEAEYISRRLLDWVEYQRKKLYDSHPELR